MSLSNIEVMSEAVLFSGTDSVAITYDFKKVPFVTATSSAHNVNVYVESITNSGCTIRTSTPINGTVHVHIIGNK